MVEAFNGFIADDCLSHGAAISFYATTALAPILLIVLAIAGFAFDNDAAQMALGAQLSRLIGPDGAGLLEAAIENASRPSSGTIATIVGLLTLVVTASGVFGEMQATLNKIWRVEPKPMSVTGLVRARAVSLGLVVALGFLLLVSLIASAAISALGNILQRHLPFGEFFLSLINGLVSFSLVALLFAAIYKVLPDRTLEWKDVIFGAVVSTALFTIGKALIGWYLGTSAVGSSYGAAGGLFVLLLWVYYSSLIFLFGAELTRAYSSPRHGFLPMQVMTPSTDG